MSKTEGVVKWFSRLKGYGFINPDDSEQEVFVHYSAIDGEGYRNLYEGDRVEFELVDRGKDREGLELSTERRKIRLAKRRRPVGVNHCAEDTRLQPRNAG